MNENNWTPDPENITEPVSDSAASFQETDNASSQAPTAAEEASQPKAPQDPFQNDGWQSAPQDAPQNSGWQSAPQDAPQNSGWQNAPQDAPQNSGWQMPPQDIPQNSGWQNAPQDTPQNGPWQMPPQNGYGQGPAPGQPWGQNQGKPGNFYYGEGPGNYPPIPPSGPAPQDPGAPKKPADKKEVTSVLLGIVSILVSCCCFPAGVCVGFAAAMAGLVLSILSRQNGRFTSYGTAGLVLSILGLVESLFLFACYMMTVRMLQDPQFSALLNELMRQNGLLP